MPAEESHVTIVAWPVEPATVEHRFILDEPCPVAISFDQTPANVTVATDPQRPIDVRMGMSLTARESLPVCIKLCEPICATSDYTVGIRIFDNAVASISLRGQTRISACTDVDTPPPPGDIPLETCVDFAEVNEESPFPAPLAHKGLVFSPLGEPLRAVTFGDPAGQVKLGFPRSGLRIDFARPVNNVRLTVNNYARPDLDIGTFSGDTLLSSFTATIRNTVAEVEIPGSSITAVTIRGGDNEAALVEVCFEAVVLR